MYQRVTVRAKSVLWIFRFLRKIGRASNLKIHGDKIINVSKSICSRAKNLTAHSCQLLPPTIEEQQERNHGNQRSTCHRFQRSQFKLYPTEGVTFVTI
jgi:hypothetical protein